MASSTTTSSTQIRVIDAVMGSGKTSYIFKQINENPNQKYLYVSPFLSEVGDPPKQQTGRIHEACPEANFKAPSSSSSSKRQDLKRLLARGENVCCTHRLFQDMDQETSCLIQDGGYEVIIDEALEVIQRFTDLKATDIPMLKHFVEVDPDTHQVKWTTLEQGGRYKDIKQLCDEGRLYHFKGDFYLWELPKEILLNAKQVTICTYLFRASVLHGYLKRHSIPFEYLDNDSLGLASEAELIAEAKERITFVDCPYIDKLGKHTLSASGYDNLTQEDLRKMKSMLESLVQRHLKAKGSELIWTCYGNQKQSLSGKGYARSFVPCNARATNEYGDRKAGIYLIDRYQHPFIDRFLSSYSAGIDGDLFALAEMLQWIWRLRIRNGQDIELAIPSKRMRTLLQRWLDGEFLQKPEPEAIPSTTQQDNLFTCPSAA